MPAANVSQKQRPRCPSRRSRERITSPPATMIASASDEPRRHRRPPELERLRAARSEQQEEEHETEVRGVEDVPAAERGSGTWRAVRRPRPPAKIHDPRSAPPVAVLGARHAQDEGDAVSRQECARGPHDHVLAPEGDPELEHARTCRSDDEDLGDREPEVERDLPEHLQRDDHRREMQPRVARRRQQDRVREPRIRSVRFPGETRSAHGAIIGAMRHRD